MSINRTRASQLNPDRIKKELVDWKHQVDEDNSGERTPELEMWFARIDAIKDGKASRETIIETMVYVRNSLILDSHLNRVLSKRDGADPLTAENIAYQKHLDTTAEFLTLQIDRML